MPLLQNQTNLIDLNNERINNDACKRSDVVQLQVNKNIIL